MLLRHVVKDYFCVFLYSAVLICVHVEIGQENDYELGRSWYSKERADTIASAIPFASTTTKSITIPRGRAWRLRLTFSIQNNHTSVKYQLHQLLSCSIIAFSSKHQETSWEKSEPFAKEALRRIDCCLLCTKFCKLNFIHSISFIYIKSSNSHVFYSHWHNI